MVINMVRCKICKKTRTRGGAKGQCWKKYRLCSLCAVVVHPEDYKKNFICATLARCKKYQSKRHFFKKSGLVRKYKIRGMTDGS